MDRKDVFELVVVAVSLLVLAGSISVVGRAADELWASKSGVLYALTSVVAVPLGGNLDIPVAFAVGALTGLFGLFFIDGTKRVQAALVFLIAGIFSFVPLVLETGRIVDTAGRAPAAFVIGCLVGLVSGVAASLYHSNMFPVDFRGSVHPREKLRWIQFPAATRGFLWGSSALVVVTGVDYVLTSAGAVTRLQTLVAAGGFVLSLIVFTQYEYQRSIVTISPPDQETGRYHPYVIGGLYEFAKEYHAMPATGEADDALADAQGIGIHSFEDLSERFDVDIKFGLLWPTFGGLSARKVMVGSESWTTNSLPHDLNRNDRSDIGVGIVFRVLRWIRHYLGLAVPQVLLETFGSQRTDVLARLDHADTALLLAPSPKEEEELPRGIKKYRELCDRYADPLSTNVVIATTEAGSVAEDLDLALDSDTLKNVCKDRLGVYESNCTLVPLDRFNGNGDDHGGFDDLLEELSD
jgi:hypothetical protein